MAARTFMDLGCVWGRGGGGGVGGGGTVGWGSLGFVEALHLLGDGGAAHHALLHHPLGDLAGHHARGHHATRLHVLRGHHHAAATTAAVLCGAQQPHVSVCVCVCVCVLT